MPGLQQIQDMLERQLGTKSMSNHNYFWRGKTRDELVATKMFGLSIVVPGRPEESNLLRAMQGSLADRDTANRLGIDLLRALFRQVRMPARDVALFEAWIREGCPEVASDMTEAAEAAKAAKAKAATDDTHVAYWRAIDDFFLPGLASPETVPHVNRMHFAALERWLPALLLGGELSSWTSYLAQPDVSESFSYVRHHQRRLIEEFYGSSQANILDSLWKFGGSLLPVDPLSHALPDTG